ncbi:VOC family protein [Halodurantibacterium flavum]|uniref:VOC family protein n=1 Tax=Halodurantibacterium flavum TaxID=1382802 RepID=A0ABW4S055_9RHOB
MIIAIDHIELIVRDVKKHVEFYEALGFKLLSWTEHHGGSAELQLPGENQPIIEIHELLTEENPGVNHISFRARDIEETYEDLVSKGISFYRDLHASPTTGRKNALFRDPDGWRLQLSSEKRVDYVKTADKT